MKTDDKIYLIIYGGFLLSIIIMFGMIVFTYPEEEVEVTGCECIEWLNKNQDIKCVVRRDTRKYYHSGEM